MCEGALVWLLMEEKLSTEGLLSLSAGVKTLHGNCWKESVDQMPLCAAVNHVSLLLLSAFLWGL